MLEHFPSACLHLVSFSRDGSLMVFDYDP